MATLMSRNEKSEMSKSQQTLKPASPGGALQPFDDARTYFCEYARERPEVAALWCLGIGFVLGWKLKPW